MNKQTNTLISLGIALLMSGIYIVFNISTSGNSLSNAKKQEVELDEPLREKEPIRKVEDETSLVEAITIEEQQRIDTKKKQIEREREEKKRRHKVREKIKKLTAFSQQDSHMQVEDIRNEIEKIRTGKYSDFKGNERSIILGRLLELKEIHIASFVIRTKSTFSPERTEARKRLSVPKKHITSAQKAYVKDLLEGKYSPRDE